MNLLETRLAFIKKFFQKMLDNVICIRQVFSQWHILFKLYIWSDEANFWMENFYGIVKFYCMLFST